MTQTPVVVVAVPPALLDKARRAIGAPPGAVSAVVRAGLAALADVDVSEYTPRRTGRPRKALA